MSTQTHIAAYIASLNTGIAAVTAGRLIPAPDDQIGVILSPGMRPTTTIGVPGTGGTLVLEYPELAVWARSKTSATVEAALDVIFRALPKIVNAALPGVSGSARYLGFDPRQSPFKLDFDADSRWLWAVNFGVSKEV